MDDATQSQAFQASEDDAVVIAYTAIEDAAVFKFDLLPEADDALRERFSRHTVQLYRQMNCTESTLSEYFAEDFSSFTAENFKSISSRFRRELRDLLRTRGVFVPKGRTDFQKVARLEEAVTWVTTHRGKNTKEVSKAIENISKS